jgi:NAD(P)-dependent dehydrogenase (short-subunit alcohol dehydrogenase family)
MRDQVAHIVRKMFTRSAGRNLTWENLMRLDGKVAAITGAAGGVGRATSLRFAAEGAHIVAADVDDDGNEETVDLVVEAGGKATAVHVDVTNSGEVAAMVDAAEEDFGKLDILFNNAGVMLPKDNDAVSTDESTIDATLAINVKGVLLGCKHGIPALRRAGGGSIINTASFVASVGAATPQIAYTASKGAVLSLTRELAVLHAREGIRVNAVSPGPLGTELLMKFLDTEEKRQRRLVHIPMGRFGESAEIANAVLFLASDEASFVTGTNLQVDGGLTAAYVTPQS